MKKGAREDGSPRTQWRAALEKAFVKEACWRAGLEGMRVASRAGDACQLLFRYLARIRGPTFKGGVGGVFAEVLRGLDHGSGGVDAIKGAASLGKDLGELEVQDAVCKH